jgi:hypothetical protein
MCSIFTHVRVCARAPHVELRRPQLAFSKYVDTFVVRPKGTAYVANVVPFGPAPTLPPALEGAAEDDDDGVGG